MNKMGFHHQWINEIIIWIAFLMNWGGKGNEEAAENRNYLAGRMTDEINEIIRVLQLTTYDEDEWDADQLTAMKRACNALESKLQAAIDWLEVLSSTNKKIFFFFDLIMTSLFCIFLRFRVFFQLTFFFYVNKFFCANNQKERIWDSNEY